MKKQFYFTLLSGFILLACSNKTEKWSLDLEKCIQSTDSINVMLNETITSEEMSTLVVDAKTLIQKVKTSIADDTLDVEFGQKLDRFSTAYRNALSLEKEFKHCKKAAKEMKLRLQNLKYDIDNSNGDRTKYCSYFTHEKGELTKIQNHCMDIRLRFDELKAAKSEFESIFLVYQ